MHQTKERPGPVEKEMDPLLMEYEKVKAKWITADDELKDVIVMPEEMNGFMKMDIKREPKMAEMELREKGPCAQIEVNKALDNWFQ